MDAIVFAAGRGSRLRPFTDDKPKPLLKVGGEPLLARCLDALVTLDVDRIVLVVGYRADQIVEAVGDSYDGIPIVYAHQHERKGLAHAVCRAAEDGYGISPSSLSSDTARTLPADVPADVLTVNGDNVFDDCALSRLRDRHADPDVDGTIVLDRISRNEATATARCELTDDGVVRSITASVDAVGAEPGYIAGGVQTHDFAALLEACLTIDRADSGEYELADALESLVARGSTYVGVELEGWHLNVNTPADLEAARKRFR